MAYANQLAVQHTASGYDFFINEVSLLRRIAKHEALPLGEKSYTCALGSVEHSRARLLLEAGPDLAQGRVALYVCGHCGGYDGAPIGARIRHEGDSITWDLLGLCSDDEERVDSPFSKVRGFRFDWATYRKALLAVSVT